MNSAESVVDIYFCKEKTFTVVTSPLGSSGIAVQVRVLSSAPYRVFITDLTVVDTRFFVRCGSGMEIDATLWYTAFEINILFGG